MHLVGFHYENMSTSLKDGVLTGQENYLPHYCITDKYWYIHVFILYTQTDVKYRSVVKEKRNLKVYIQGELKVFL